MYSLSNSIYNTTLKCNCGYDIGQVSTAEASTVQCPSCGQVFMFEVGWGARTTPSTITQTPRPTHVSITTGQTADANSGHIVYIKAPISPILEDKTPLNRKGRRAAARRTRHV